MATMSLLKIDKLGFADKWGFVAWIGCIIILILGAIWFGDDGSFVRGIFTSLFGALLSISIGILIIPEIIRVNAEQIGQKRAKTANIELFNSINASHRSFCELQAKIGKSERWAKIWDKEDATEAGSYVLAFYHLIDREEDSINIHSKMTMGYIHPEIESRKEAYLYSLRQLRTRTHNAAIALGNREKSEQFSIAESERFSNWRSLVRSLVKTIDLDAAIKLNEDDPSLNTVKGFALCDKGKYTEAIPWFEKAIKLDPGYINAHAGMQAALKGLKQAAEAKAANMASAKTKELV